MRRNQSPLEDFTDIMSRLPWWLNIILAFISYAIIHKVAMHFYDPAPQALDVGKMGEYAVSKMLPAIALFGQFVMPFAFILAGFGGVVRKFRRTKEYKELLFYIGFVAILFGTIVAQSGGVHKSMMDRVQEPKKQEISQENEEKIYTWLNENGQTVYSNHPRK
ncbi:MAG: hypothetical protein PHI97_31240 [Desulfobulbus sp.]|nr:hypothetical protein [Desulfobulbus sp.]